LRSEVREKICQKDETLVDKTVEYVRYCVDHCRDYLTFCKLGEADIDVTILRALTEGKPVMNVFIHQHMLIATNENK